jgi:hypothetical protein|tara:strand:+ start:234 stop:440 length:207 start_codon:yes stop_codon:yes gene_type:complete
MGKKIELTTAIEHYGDGMRRGELAGREMEYTRIMDVLRKHGHYDAVLTMRTHLVKTSVVKRQSVVTYS